MNSNKSHKKGHTSRNNSTKNIFRGSRHRVGPKSRGIQ